MRCPRSNKYYEYVGPGTLTIDRNPETQRRYLPAHHQKGREDRYLPEAWRGGGRLGACFGVRAGD